MAPTSPRRLVAAFIAGALLFVAAVPAVNAWRRGALPGSASELFDIDFRFLNAGGLLRHAGVSTLPRQVIVGKGDWLFLGDQYAQGISVKRRPASPADRQVAQRMADNALAWRRWLAAEGVREDWVLVVADKDSIFPDRLPDWDRPAAPSAMDVAMAAADPRRIVDSRPALRRERGVDGAPLYARTDSHWTVRGAWVGYRALSQVASDAGSSAAWLRDGDVRFAETDLAEGDLARLLHVASPARDRGARVTLAGAWAGERTQFDADTGEALSAASLEVAEPLRRVVRIVSPHALNRSRLLWLRDSSGAALVPFVAATFREVIEVDRASTSSAQWAALVRRLRPDAVLVSVVERNARDAWFQALPPASAQ